LSRRFLSLLLLLLLLLLFLLLFLLLLLEVPFLSLLLLDLLLPADQQIFVVMFVCSSWSSLKNYA
jgi:hypothetical protein